MGRVCVYLGEALARYGFGHGHPFSSQRMGAFEAAARARGLDRHWCECAPVQADVALLKRFHTADYIERVQAQSRTGEGFLDFGDTPAFPGVFEAAAAVVGSSVDAARRILRGECRRAFVPIAGLHHARRDRAAGFCVFNDCGVVIETLRAEFGLRRIGYVDIDAHHGDGVYYSYDDDPDLIFADLHEDGRFLYPGTGAAEENGRGAAAGTKLNIPLPPQAGDAEFLEAWERVEGFLRVHPPEFLLFQCGADSLAGDPITDLQYSAACHRHAAARLCALADEFCEGRLLAMGGGGYRLENLAQAWTAVVEAMLGAHAPAAMQ